MSNTLAYYVTAAIATVKVFIVQAPVVSPLITGTLRLAYEFVVTTFLTVFSTSHNFTNSEGHRDTRHNDT